MISQWRSLLRLVLPSLATLLVLFLAARGYGTLPALGPAFNPGSGVWAAASDTQLPHSQTLHLSGLQRPVSVLFERNGTAHVQAATDHDLFLATGYLHARFRLFQMDLERRQAQGRLSQVVGAAALPLDEFELRLGLHRTALAETRALPGEARMALEAYAQGINDRIAEDRRDDTWPAMFHILGYTPDPWSPVDTVDIQGDMTQTLDFISSPLDAAVLVRKLGYARTARWFPVLPQNQQHPYDPRPYRRLALAPVPPQTVVGPAEYREIASLARSFQALGVSHGPGNSNNWAVAGAKTVSGMPLMAGDPHLHQTLPAIWYQIDQESPHYHVMGVTIPGTPVVLIGRNRHMSWSLTNTQNQATLFYLEKTDSSHPHQYFWRGAWRRMQRIGYDIPIKGGGSQHIEVDLTVHGPIVSDDRLPGRKIAVDWMGALPSDDLPALLRIGQARTFAQFRNALRGWHAPTQNFIYADDSNHIGIVAPGYYPIVKAGIPWLPLDGTGADDIVGTVPPGDVPEAHDPAARILFSANQRPVGRDYPYYIGTSLDDFDNGYRADRIQQVLHRGTHLTMHDMERLQNDLHDYLAIRLKAHVLAALPAGGMSRSEVQARSLFERWDGSMDGGSAAASIWWTFWDRYLHDTFDPWWQHYHVPADKFDSLKVGPDQASLAEDLEAWTLGDPANAAFSLPDGTHRTAPAVIRRAFHEAIADLTRQLGSDPGSWRWGRLHTRSFPSLIGADALGYGPRAAGGDLYTVDVADPMFDSDHGPSWRMIVDWGSGKAEGVYPGGQSENPASPWYQNEVSAWWNGKYYPLLDMAGARAQPGSITWSIQP